MEWRRVSSKPLSIKFYLFHSSKQFTHFRRCALFDIKYFATNISSTYEIGSSRWYCVCLLMLSCLAWNMVLETWQMCVQQRSYLLTDFERADTRQISISWFELNVGLHVRIQTIQFNSLTDLNTRKATQTAGWQGYLKKRRSAKKRTNKCCRVTRAKTYH